MGSDGLLSLPLSAKRRRADDALLGVGSHARALREIFFSQFPHTLNKKETQSNFTWGNAASLREGDASAVAALRKMHDEHYHAQNMKLVVVGTHQSVTSDLQRSRVGVAQWRRVSRGCSRSRVSRFFRVLEGRLARAFRRA